MLKIKLLLRGKKHQPSYRIVVAEARSKSNGQYIDDLGFYTPQTKTLQLDKSKMSQWQKNGAQITTGVDRLLNPSKYPKKIRVKKETEVKAEPKAKPEPKIEVTPPPEVKPEAEVIPTPEVKTE